MRFLCVECDEVMEFAERELPGDGTLTALFSCGACGREIAMLTNPMETSLVTSLGVEIGGRTLPEQPFQQTRTRLEGARDDAFAEVAPSPPTSGEDRPGDGTPSAVSWSVEATERLARVPSFVRGMVKRIYTEYAREHAIATITPAVMDRARADLGLEGM